METGIEPVCTALQAVASPLGHSTAGSDTTCNPRADDGIRTRDPHLGKVMRYQLRYIRAQRARSSPGAKHDDSRREPTRTTFSVPSAASPSVAYAARSAEVSARANLRPRSPLGAGPVAQWESVRFTRGRSLVRSQPGPQILVQLAVSPKVASIGIGAAARRASAGRFPTRRRYPRPGVRRAVRVSPGCGL